jgi:hypothetical protein
MIAHESGFVVGIEGGDERSAGAISLLGDAAGERQGVERGGHEEFLAGLETEANANCDFSKLIEFIFVGSR